MTHHKGTSTDEIIVSIPVTCDLGERSNPLSTKGSCADKYLIGGAGDKISSTAVFAAVSSGAKAVKTSGCGSGYIGGITDKPEVTEGPKIDTLIVEPEKTANDAGTVTAG